MVKFSPQKLTPSLVLRTVKEYIFITFGLFLYSFAWTGIILPAKIVGGGVSGMAMLIYFVTGGADGGIPIGYSLFVINAVLILFAAFIIGVQFGAKTIFAVFMLSLAMSIMQSITPPNLIGLADDRLLSAILGGACSGIGISICFMQGGSTGGTDIIAMIINKYRNISYGKVIMFCDFIIIGCSYFIGNGISTVIYSYIIVAVSGYMLDTILAGNRQSSQILIISQNYQAIADHISTELRRGVTLLDGEGWYTKEPIKVVLVVCRKNETSSLFRIIKEFDPQAFITVGSVMGVYGLGFEALKK